MKRVLEEKQIPVWVDFWGYDVNHDWPWWRKQIAYFYRATSFYPITTGIVDSRFGEFCA